MKRTAWALLGVSFVVAVTACSGPGDGSMLQADFQTAVVDEPDGRVSLYSGHLIADALARGDDVESLSFMTAFLRVRVPRSLVDAVPPAPLQPIFISLEQVNAGVELLLHEFDHETAVNGRATRMKNSTFNPADPWLTGHAQVQHDLSGALVGGAHIVKYSGTSPLGSAEYVLGMTSCTGQPGCPALLYDNPDPCRWPLPLPSGWTLELLQQDGPPTLEALCQKH